jgi:hypothetical protein
MSRQLSNMRKVYRQGRSPVSNSGEIFKSRNIIRKKQDGSRRSVFKVIKVVKISIKR